MRPGEIPAFFFWGTRMTIALIAAMDLNGVIGKDGTLPWKLRDDMVLFKMQTYGHNVYMGRKTWESIGAKPLPGRDNIVFSNQLAAKAGENSCEILQFGNEFVDVYRVHQIDNVLSDIGANYHSKKQFVIGGAKLYEATLPDADELYITRVLAEVEGDTVFPDIDLHEWKLITRLDFPKNDRNDHAFFHAYYVRK
jgi:dihydrofolate reductase